MKPFHFTEEDCDYFVRKEITAIGEPTRIGFLSVDHANSRIAPLVKVNEVMREALERQIHPHVEEFCKERARAVLAECERIMKESEEK